MPHFQKTKYGDISGLHMATIANNHGKTLDILVITNKKKKQTCTVVYICNQQKSRNKPPAIPSLIKTIP